MTFDDTVSGKASLRPAIGDEQDDPFAGYAGALGNVQGGVEEINEWIDEIRGRKRDQA